MRSLCGGVVRGGCADLGGGLCGDLGGCAGLVRGASQPAHLATEILQNLALVREISTFSLLSDHEPILHGIASIESSKFTNVCWGDEVPVIFPSICCCYQFLQAFCGQNCM